MEDDDSKTHDSPCANDSLERQVKELNAEIRKIQNEYNSQRAKMKELYLQKQTDLAKTEAEKIKLQTELNDLKSQCLVADLKSENEMQLKDIKAQEEISSLQQLVQDTIEELTSCKIEMDILRKESDRLLQENRELKESLQQQQLINQQQPITESAGGLGPQMLTQVKKTLARRLGTDSSSSGFQQESFDSIRMKDSSQQYAEEDAEVLRSIVEQLQEEMKMLKEKLRNTDEQLQAKSNYKKTSDEVLKFENEGVHRSTSMEISVLECKECQQNEIKVQECNIKNERLEEQLKEIQKKLDESLENLQKEAALRKDLENQWQEKRGAHSAEVHSLREQVKKNEQALLSIQENFLVTKNEIQRQLQRLIDDRKRINKHLETLQADNDFLSGRYLATAEQIDNENINLPNTVVELQELILQRQNELIQARMSSEFEKQKCDSSRDEIQLLRDELKKSLLEKNANEEKAKIKMKSLEERITNNLGTLKNLEISKTQLERKESELNKQLSEARVMIIELNEQNEKLSKMNVEFKTKTKNLQENQDTSEQVQKDLVQLTQTLQISLEKLRHAETEVRWQDDDDVDSCPTCAVGFTVTVRKIHCRHCGHIFCDKCLTKTVPSGPRKRSARVCDICHTLLTPHIAPYFSHEPLQSN